MSKMKLLLDVVEDLRHLADSIQAVADAMMATHTMSAVINLFILLYFLVEFTMFTHS